MLIIDTEVYRDYFLLSAKEVSTGKVRHFEMYEGHPFDSVTVKRMMQNYTTVSFNGYSFDLPIITTALSGWNNIQVKGLCDSIIKSNLPSYRICNEAGIHVPRTWDHIDLIEVAIGKVSLKIYGGRLGAKRMQDLPFKPDSNIAPSERATVRYYCVNDLDTTELLLNTLQPQIDLRESMSVQYGIDLRSKSDAQIAETIINSELTKITGKAYTKPTIPDGQAFRYLDPQIVSFKTPALNDVFKTLLATRFALGANGAVVMPKALEDTKVVIDGREYQMGIGGLHSCESKQYVTSNDAHLLFDLDVASFYPNIILQQNLAPKSLGLPFLKVYQGIVDRRMKAKRAGDKVTADVLKIAVNGSFGKLGSKWSFLYAPDLLIQTTITGQLCLLMLIERITGVGASIVSANTDGIVVHCPKHLESDVLDAAWSWEMDTTFMLERTDYKSIASRDVNNYVAVKLDGKTKGKGVFTQGGIGKNPDCQIVQTAVAKYVAHGTPVRETIRECRDILQFVKVRSVKGGALWRDELLGKAVRFYYSTEIHSTECIRYVLNNKVPMSDGAMPMMNIPDEFPTDINYDVYFGMADKLIKEVGC